MALAVTSDQIRARTLPPGSVDPNVKIPRAVAAAGKRSQEIQEQLFGTAEPSVAAHIETVNASGEPAPAPEPTPAPEPAQPAPEPAPAPAPAPAPEPAPAPVAAENWEQKYKRLHGRHEADGKKNKELMQQLGERMTLLEQENARLRSAPAATPASLEPQNLLSEKEIEDFGPELVDIMERVARGVAAPLQAHITQLTSQMGDVQIETGNAVFNRMTSTLDAQVPGWAELNKEPKFMEWAQLPDVFSGAIRKQLMQEAWNSGAAHRVAAFFHAFLAEEAATNPPGSSAQPQRPASRPAIPAQPALIVPASPAPALDLTTLASPGRAHSAGGAPAEKPVYTSAEITRFYTDVAAGRWRGREQMRAAIDADISAAQHEGRIIIDQRTVLPRDPHMR